MTGVNMVLAYAADQKSVSAYAKEKQISARNTFLHSLVVRNNNASTDFYVQIYDVTGANVAALDAAADLVTPEFDVLVPAGSFVPFSFPGGWRFHNGCYVRAVTTATGATAQKIAASDAKFTASYMDGPVV